MKKAVSINKIVEIDIDTDRKQSTIVRQLKSTNFPGRRPIDPTEDLSDLLIMVREAFMCLILHAEQMDGKPGEL